MQLDPLLIAPTLLLHSPLPELQVIPHQLTLPILSFQQVLQVIMRVTSQVILQVLQVISQIILQAPSALTFPQVLQVLQALIVLLVLPVLQINKSLEIEKLLYHFSSSHFS